jgi:signal transduction histidine kinase
MRDQSNARLTLPFRRRTLRLQLVLLYAGLFFGLGVVLLVIVAGVAVFRGSSSVAAGSSGPAQSSTHTIAIGGILALGVTVVLSLALGWIIAGRFLQPLRAMTAMAREISATNLNRRLDLGGPADELRELGQTLDDLFARLEGAFAAQRRFIANAAHELRTPLAAERTLLQVALADPNASVETLRSACEEVVRLGQQQQQMIDALLTLASSEGGIDVWQSVDVAEVVEEVVKAHEAETARYGLQLKEQLSHAQAAGDRRLIECLVTNLIENAIHHNATAGWIEVSTSTKDGNAFLTLRNSGPVIPEDAVDRLFEPFQRLSNGRMRQSDRHGLGLAIVQAIANAHGATLSARAMPDGGLDITVFFRTP